MDNLKSKLLQSFEKVYEQSRESGLESSCFQKLNTELAQIADYFNVSRTQAFFVGLIFGLSYERSNLDMNDVVKHLKCNPVKVLRYNSDIDELYLKGILQNRKSRKSAGRIDLGRGIGINCQVIEAVLAGKPLPDLQKNSFDDFLQLLEYVSSLCEEVEDETMQSSAMLANVSQILEMNRKFSLTRRVLDLKLPKQDIVVYFYTLWQCLLGEEEVNLGRLLEDIIDRKLFRARYLQGYITGTNALLKHELVDTVESHFANDIEITASDTSIQYLKEEGLSLAKKCKKKYNLMAPETIDERELIYNEKELSQLHMFRELLTAKGFKDIRNRLEKKGMPKGITALFHGAPGTGKTETVLQLSRQTGRELMKVDISASKSMWFGESEKKIKRIFTRYADYAKEAQIMPILLFNEADAIISKRKPVNSSSISQTENAIQNIILEELENFQGILIATTNLVKNLDSAFERRFLFKIKFLPPDLKSKAKIWKIKLPFLSETHCETLAQQFQFSGGQIDNVARKSEIYEVVHGKNITFTDVINFCHKELLDEKSNTAIGFIKNG